MILHSSVEGTRSSDSDSDSDRSSEESVEECVGSGNEGAAEKVSYSQPYADAYENEGVVVLSEDDISVDDKVVDMCGRTPLQVSSLRARLTSQLMRLC